MTYKEVIETIEKTKWDYSDATRQKMLKDILKNNNVVRDDALTNGEFCELVTTLLLGSDYYIVDPVDMETGNAIVLEDLIKKFGYKYLIKG